MNFKNQFFKKIEVNVITKDVILTGKVDVEVDSEVTIDIDGEVIHLRVFML